jgi:hypothetical protein
MKFEERTGRSDSMHRAAKLLQASTGEMKICHANGVVKEVLETSGFGSLIKMYADENDAVAAFGG